MKTPEPGPREFLSKRFLVLLLSISIVTNIVLITKQKNPDILNKIQFAFIPAPAVAPTDHVRGNPQAKYTVIAYTDFQCPYCANFHEAMSSVAKETDVRWVYRQFPLSFHPFAEKAAEASECAGEQGKFWEYGDALFALKGHMTDDTFSRLAQKLGLDWMSFGLCLSSGKYASVVAAQRDEGGKKKIKGTPTFWLNGKRFDGSVPVNALRKQMGIIHN
jgi:protein-disulfide isomerase